MNSAPFQTLVTFLPLLGLLCGIALLVSGIVRKSPSTRQLSRWAFALTALATAVVYAHIAAPHGTLMARGALVGSGLTGVVASAGLVMDGPNPKLRQTSIYGLITASFAALVLVLNGF